MRKIVFEVDAAGKVMAEAEGYQGEACLVDLKKFAVLESPGSEYTAKPEYYETNRGSCGQEVKGS